MFFKNKLTGLIHEVIHLDHVKRCQNDDNYEEVKIKNEEKKVEVKTNTSTKRTSTKK